MGRIGDNCVADGFKGGMISKSENKPSKPAEPPPDHSQLKKSRRMRPHLSASRKLKTGFRTKMHIMTKAQNADPILSDRRSKFCDQRSATSSLDKRTGQLQLLATAIERPAIETH